VRRTIDLPAAPATPESSPRSRTVRRRDLARAADAANEFVIAAADSAAVFSTGVDLFSMFSGLDGSVKRSPAIASSTFQAGSICASAN